MRLLRARQLLRRRPRSSYGAARVLRWRPSIPSSTSSTPARQSRGGTRGLAPTPSLFARKGLSMTHPVDSRPDLLPSALRLTRRAACTAVMAAAAFSAVGARAADGDAPKVKLDTSAGDIVL